MVVKTGYKQTEVGVIPEEWEVPYLRQRLLQDATYGVVKAGAFQRTGIPMLRSGEIKNGAISEDHPLITPEKSHEYARTILKKNDVVIALVGYPGETAVIPERLVGANISRAVGLLRPAQNLRPEYLTCYLNSPNGRKEFLRPSAGSAQIVVNLGALNKLRLPVPPHPEQCAIASALSDVDGVLGGLDRLIAKKRDLKQAAVQQLLTGKTRLPGFHDEWEVKRLDEVTTRLANGAVYRPSSDNGLPVTRIETIADGTIDMSRVGYGMRTPELEKYRMCQGDILFSHINSVDHIGKVALYGGRPPLYHGMNLLLLRASSSLNCQYLFYWFSSHQGRKKAVSLARQAVSQASINTTDLKCVEIPIPPLPEQAAIAEILTETDAELAALEQRRKKTRALKQAMMQELLTGRTRLV